MISIPFLGNDDDEGETCDEHNYEITEIHDKTYTGWDLEEAILSGGDQPASVRVSKHCRRECTECGDVHQSVVRVGRGEVELGAVELNEEYLEFARDE